MIIQIVRHENDRMKCQNCPLWNNDRMWCQHPAHDFPANDWSPTNDPFDTCPLRKEILTIEIILL